LEKGKGGRQGKKKGRRISPCFWGGRRGAFSSSGRIREETRSTEGKKKEREGREYAYQRPMVKKKRDYSTTSMSILVGRGEGRGGKGEKGIFFQRKKKGKDEPCRRESTFSRGGGRGKGRGPSVLTKKNFREGRNSRWEMPSRPENDSIRKQTMKDERAKPSSGEKKGRSPLNLERSRADLRPLLIRRAKGRSYPPDPEKRQLKRTEDGTYSQWELGPLEGGNLIPIRKESHLPMPCAISVKDSGDGAFGRWKRESRKGSRV